jgi:hypothetical protein
MISDLDERMKYTEDTLIRDLPISNRTRGVFENEFGPDATIRDAKHMPDRELLRLINFGEMSLREWKTIRDMVLNSDREADARQQRVELHSLLLAHESAVIALYDLQRADADADELLGIDRDGSITKRQRTVARIREEILDKFQHRGCNTL